MALIHTNSYLADSLAVFRYYQGLGERAMAQVNDEQLFAAPDTESNSIAIIVKHLAGNMRSRWTDFLTTDGEKPWRNRDSEFEDAAPIFEEHAQNGIGVECFGARGESPSRSLCAREALLEQWNQGWGCLYEALQSLTDADLTRTVTIRGEPHSVIQAINRQVAHYSYHVGQIVFLARQLANTNWTSLSVPRKQSAEFNRKVAAGEASQR